MSQSNISSWQQLTDLKVAQLRLFSSLVILVDGHWIRKYQKNATNKIRWEPDNEINFGKYYFCPTPISNIKYDLFLSHVRE